MKKFFKIVSIVIVILVLLYFVIGFIFNAVYDYNRTKNLKLNTSTITVEETEYLNYLEELYININKYIGKEIIIEGFYDTEEINGNVYQFVGRDIKHNEDEYEHDHSDECECANSVGLEFIYDGEPLETGAFIQVKGKLALVKDETDEGMEYLTLTDCEIKTDIPVGKKYVE